MISSSFSKAAAATGCLTAGTLAASFAGTALPFGAAVVAGAAFLGLGAAGCVAAIIKPPSVSLPEVLREAKGELALIALAGGLWGAVIGGGNSSEAGKPTDIQTSSVLDPDAVIGVKASDKWCDTVDGPKEVEINGRKYTLSCK